MCDIFGRVALPSRSWVKLSAFPYVLLRLGCDRCERRGQYRLARLAANYGADATVAVVIEQLMVRGCRHGSDCQARCLDLVPPNKPPDMPKDLRAFSLVKGGKA